MLADLILNNDITTLDILLDKLEKVLVSIPIKKENFAKVAKAYKYLTDNKEEKSYPTELITTTVYLQVTCLLAD